VIVGALKIKLLIEGSGSLKEKRRVLKSIKDKAMGMNASVAEVEDNDLWQAATLGAAFVSNNAAHVNSMMDKFVQGIHNNVDVEVIDSNMEIIHL
jgi:uncharacterized protein